MCLREVTKTKPGKEKFQHAASGIGKLLYRIYMNLSHG
jgi:hypothetical protein